MKLHDLIILVLLVINIGLVAWVMVLDSKLTDFFDDEEE